MFSYGSLAPVFYEYLLALGIDVTHAGFLMTGILLGDLMITLNLTTRADTFGRKYVLLIGSILKCGAGVVFAVTDNFVILLFAGIVGVISTSGGEIGPFVNVEQASLTDKIKGYCIKKFKENLIFNLEIYILMIQRYNMTLRNTYFIKLKQKHQISLSRDLHYEYLKQSLGTPP